MTGDNSRRPDYRFARLVVAATLTFVVTIMVVADILPPFSYDVQPVVLVPLLGTIAGMLSVEIIDLTRRKDD